MQKDNRRCAIAGLFTFFVCMAVADLFARAPADPDNPSPFYRVKSVEVFKEEGGRVDWSARRNLIVFDKTGREDRFDVYIMNPDGTGEKCLTCGLAGLPRGHRGQPAWHPSGNWIVFQAENHHSGGSLNEQPSLGINNDLYLIPADGSAVWPLTQNPKGYAVLHPKFSHDGTKILWAERYEKGRGSRWGHWRLRLADFDGASHALRNVRTIQPGRPCWYESHGFSPDGTKIYFSGNMRGGKGNDIFQYDLRSGRWTCLTEDKDIWDEMAELSPRGDKIAFISNRFEPKSGRWGFLTLKTEIYLMDPDGRNVQQVTFLNDKKHHYVTGDLAWSPAGDELLAVSFERKEKKKVILRVRFAGDSPSAGHMKD